MSDGWEDVLDMLKGGVGRVLAERVRHARKGYDDEHDAAHLPGELLSAAVAYSIYAWWQHSRDASGNRSGWTEDMVLDIVLERWWPWDAGEWQPEDDAAENMVKAASLIAAEIDRCG